MSTTVRDEPTILSGYAGIRAAAGNRLGTSAWFGIDQARIDGFAETTCDHAWIHVDTARAAAGPFGGTIAHGLLLLSLITPLAAETFRVTGVRSALHYGYDRVRFIRPVIAGSSIRAEVFLRSVDGDEAIARAMYRAIVEILGVDHPACVADLIYFYEFDTHR